MWGEKGVGGHAKKGMPSMKRKIDRAVQGTQPSPEYKKRVTTTRKDWDTVPLFIWSVAGLERVLIRGAGLVFLRGTRSVSSSVVPISTTIPSPNAAHGIRWGSRAPRTIILNPEAKDDSRPYPIGCLWRCGVGVL